MSQVALSTQELKSPNLEIAEMLLAYEFEITTTFIVECGMWILYISCCLYKGREVLGYVILVYSKHSVYSGRVVVQNHVNDL